MARDFIDPNTIEEIQRDPEASAVDMDDLRKLIIELKTRQLESLNLYEPMPWQQEFHACRAKESLILKANQVGGPQPPNESVLTPSGWRQIGDLSPGDVVIGGDGIECHVVATQRVASTAIYRVTFDDGSSTTCADEHHWLCKMTHQSRMKEGEWKVAPLVEIRTWGGNEPNSAHRTVVPECVTMPSPRPVPLDPYVLGVLLGDGSIGSRMVAFCSANEDTDIVDNVSRGLPEGAEIKIKERRENCTTYRIVAADGRKGRYCNNPVTKALRELGLYGSKAVTKFIPKVYLYNSFDVRLAILQGLMDTDGCINEIGHCSFATISQQLAIDIQELTRSLGGKCRINWRRCAGKVTKNGINHRHDMAIVTIRIPGVNKFRLGRKAARQVPARDTSHRILKKIEYVGESECVCIQVDSPSHTYVTSDYIVTHNSLANFVEVARAVTGQDPWNKYPKKDGTAVCVGYGERHIGQVIYRYLFRWGAFKIIRDLETGDWRTYHPWPNKVNVGGKWGDNDRKTEARPAPPLIPKRFIEGKISWQRRSADIFERVQFKTGWTLYAFNSAGDPEHAQGLTNVWLYDFDEDVAQGGWYEEAVQRTSSCNGFLRWNAMPHSKTEDIMRFVERGDEEEGKESPDTVIIRVKQADNPYLDEKAREQNARIAMSMGEDVYRRRILGELTLDSVRMYPTFDKYIHNVVVPMSKQDREDEANGRKIRTWLQKVYADNGFKVPGDWTRYVIIDPGHETCAAIFIATPPESFGDWRLQYDEIYIKKSTASKFARAMKERSENQIFQTFIFDMHGGSLRGAGDKRWVHEYQDEFERLKIECVERGPRFAPACDNITYREQCLRKWMELRMEPGVGNGCPTLYIDMPRCPNTVREILAFKKKTIKQNGQDVTIDEANRRGSVHTVECSEYAAAHGCRYIRPPESKLKDEFDSLMEQRAHRAKKRRMKSSFMGNSNTITLGPRGE